MPKALPKASQQAGTERFSGIDRPSDLRPVETAKGVVPADHLTDVMIDPLHPMHRVLLARISGESGVDDRLPRPQRLAITFYASIAAWALVWLAVEFVMAML